MLSDNTSHTSALFRITTDSVSHLQNSWSFEKAADSHNLRRIIYDPVLELFILSSPLFTFLSVRLRHSSACFSSRVADTQHPGVDSQLLQHETCSPSRHNTPCLSSHCPWAICLLCILQICQCYLIIMHTKVLVVTLTMFAKLLSCSIWWVHRRHLSVCSYGPVCMWSLCCEFMQQSRASSHSEKALTSTRPTLWSGACDFCPFAMIFNASPSSALWWDSESLLFKCFKSYICVF